MLWSRHWTNHHEPLSDWKASYFLILYPKLDNSAPQLFLCIVGESLSIYNRTNQRDHGFYA